MRIMRHHDDRFAVLAIKRLEQVKDFISGFTRNQSGRWIARLADGNEQPVGRLYSDRVRSIAGR